MNDSPRPGWYLDPSDRAWLRWWTGTDWTDFRQPNLRPDTAGVGARANEESLSATDVAPGWWGSRTGRQRFGLALGATGLVACAALLPMGLVEAAGPETRDSSCKGVTTARPGC